MTINQTNKCQSVPYDNSFENFFDFFIIVIKFQLLYCVWS